eukprot:CAMPEP_0116032666 /NCGR_PEP_ID=MMETSP0321-20121206/18312_1 /TAXON_ID=163516 /ORGANISM="Leptocylindrus danicus var. danicus, Strain B650" /LENGTH=651 /DNA_ID=CAMNT_0003508159 /DNA_START=572 /DNA_END=2527 /DNA_ORIENTATION=+
MAQTADPMTIGTRLDALIASGAEYLNNASQAQVCATLFVSSVAFSFALLNCGKGAHGSSLDPTLKPLYKNTMEPIKTKVKSPDGSREPRWYIFKMLNYTAVATFSTSVLHFILYSDVYMNNDAQMMKLMGAWTLFVLYFFGFFGVSFVDTDDHLEGSSPAEDEISEMTADQASPSAVVAVAKQMPVKAAAPIHPPAPSHPVCSDKNLTKDALTSSSATPAVKKSSSLSLDLQSMTNEELADLVLTNKMKDHQLETKLNPTRAVPIRRLVFEKKLASLGHAKSLDELPYEHSLSYERVFGANCEIVVGYVPLPVGMVGPCTLNGESVYIPMATTEGCLVASTNRGCKAITAGGGAVSTLLRDGITRAPCLRFESAAEAAALALWAQEPHNFAKLKAAFESTTSFGKLLSATPTVAGKNCYLRLKCFSGDAMGMNMVSKGSLAVVDLLRQHFPTLKLVALSGNMCTDKKPAAINWIEGRGKSVVVEATIPKDIVRTVLKTTVKAIVDTNLQKNLIGSAMSGSVGGYNAHASNIVTAVFLATGQDPAQNVESSNCITIMEETDDGDLWISCTMPSIEVGTVGGGTSLPAQAACLKAIGVKGGGDIPGGNARKLAHVVAVATMAGELSLLAALAANTLVQAHMQHNRKPATPAKK